MPILGITASQISGHLSSPGYDSIATNTVATTAASITLSSIPSTYTHLQLRVQVKSTSSGTDWFYIRFNGVDTSSNYYGHWLYGNGSSALTSAPNPPGNTSAIVLGDTPGTAATNVFSSFVIDILNYTSTNKTKVLRSLGGYDANGTGMVALSSGLALSTSAITSITIGGYNGAMNTNSSFALYGIKGA